jgi:hypothetical protein
MSPRQNMLHDAHVCLRISAYFASFCRLLSSKEGAQRSTAAVSRLCTRLPPCPIVHVPLACLCVSTSRSIRGDVRVPAIFYLILFPEKNLFSLASYIFAAQEDACTRRGEKE